MHFSDIYMAKRCPYYFSFSLTVVVPLLSMEAQKALRFHQK